tara:strand:+ start:1093 stop:1320 length:228 start_codon:yes stop_codon:yes gene_type:complete
MKITKARLRQIIKEEISKASEIDFTGGIEPGVDPAASKEADLGAAIEAARAIAHTQGRRDIVGMLDQVLAELTGL